MKGEGTIGVVGATTGEVSADIVLEDGSKWAFVGAIGGLEGGVALVPVSGDFPGVDHMSGPCWVTIAGGGVGVGHFQVSWSDTHGDIGTVTGKGWAADLSYAAGAGAWTQS